MSYSIISIKDIYIRTDIIILVNEISNLPKAESNSKHMDYTII